MAYDYLKALNLIKEGKWDEAHELVQPHFDLKSCLIHAYLHRIEGDLSNARYWYRRANQVMPNYSLDQELKHLYQVVQE